MDTVDRVIIELSKAAVFNITPSIPKEKIDWEAVYAKAVSQNISGLLFSALEKFKICFSNNELYQKWKNSMLQTVLISTKKNQELYRIINEAGKNDIAFICLKGSVIKDLYPIPELRTMGDFDVLVKKRDINKIINIFNQNGYAVKKDPFCLNASKKFIHWEIFTTLEEEFRAYTDYYDKSFFDNLTVYNGMQTVNTTLFCTHLIAHMSKHYLSSGVGIRTLIDIAVFINKYLKEINFDYVKHACTSQGFGGVYNYTINAVHDFFDINIDKIKIEKQCSEKFVEYMFAYGVLGKTDNTIIHQADKLEDDSIGFVRKVFFPSVKLLKSRYKYLNKYPFLLPLAWGHRFFSAIVGWKYSINKMLSDINEANEFSKKREKALKDLGLIKNGHII